MAEYNIGAVAKLTGISTHNLRMWEKRYNMHVSGRTSGGRRVYSQEDVERLSLIKRCIDLGHSIGNLAHLGTDELKQNLKDLSQADSNRQAGNDEPLALAVISNSPLSLDKEKLEGSDIELLPHCKRVEELATHTASADIIIIEAPVVTEELLGQLGKLKVAFNPGLILMIYRMAHRDELQSARNMDVRPVKAPVDTMEIEDILLRFADRVKRKAPPAANDSITAAARHFTSEQLDKLGDRNYNINCECPRHMSEIIQSMLAFELYSVSCLNRNADDAALHARIYEKTSQARNLMEGLLWEVLEAEGIKL